MSGRDYPYREQVDDEGGRGSGGGGSMGGRWTVPVLVIGGLIAALTVGGMAFHWSHQGESGDGEFFTRIESFCLPQNETAIYQASGSRADLLNITSVQLKFTGHSVEMMTQFFLPFVVDAPAADFDLRVLVDSRCLPPSLIFATCTEPCPDAATSTEPLLNLSATTQFFQGGVTSNYFLEDDQDYSPDIFEVNGIQGLVDDEQLFYGNLLTLRIPAAATGNVIVSNVRVTASYNMNTHKTWEPPAFCRGGPCLDPDLE